MLIVAIAAVSLTKARLAFLAATIGAAGLWVTVTTAAPLGLGGTLGAVFTGMLVGGTIMGLGQQSAVRVWPLLLVFGLAFMLGPHLPLAGPDATFRLFGSALSLPGLIATVAILAATTAVTFMRPAELTAGKPPRGPAVVLVIIAAAGCFANKLNFSMLHNLAAHHGGVTPGVRLAWAAAGIATALFICAIAVTYALSVTDSSVSRALITTPVVAVALFSGYIVYPMRWDFVITVVVLAVIMALLARRFDLVPWEAAPLAIGGVIWVGSATSSTSGHLARADVFGMGTNLVIALACAYLAFIVASTAVAVRADQRLGDGRRKVHAADVAVSFGVLVLVTQELSGFLAELAAGEPAAMRGLGVGMLAVAALTIGSVAYAKWRRSLPPPPIATATEPA
jgi:hypothetical protein